ncbi:MAG: fibronectin type III domain-containing protein [Bacteroides sp.]|nr:fibronectin type III domain-containing protein [Bacteroides sp.]
MKLKLKYTMMLLIFLSASSWLFVACSDDDNDVMGAVAINSCQYTAATVTPIWTLVPNSNCDGYIVALYQGTRSNVGALVEEKTFDFRTCSYTFTNLTPSTDYVISTQAIPSASSGFSSAEMYWKEFTTSAK